MQPFPMPVGCGFRPASNQWPTPNSSWYTGDWLLGTRFFHLTEEPREELPEPPVEHVRLASMRQLRNEPNRMRTRAHTARVRLCVTA